MKVKLYSISIFILLSVNAYGQIDMLTATLANQQIHDFQRERIRSEYEEEKKRFENNHHNSKHIITKPSDTSPFLFVPNAQTSIQVKQSIIDNIKKKNPNSKLDEALNSQNNPYPDYVKLFKLLGLDVTHNYADAFTAYMLGMWRIANEMIANPSKQQIQYVRDQVVAIMDVGRMTNSEKQESAEYLIYDLIFANEPYEGSRLSKNQRQLQADSDAVYNRFLKQNNMDLRKMRISENGLTKESQ